MRQHGERLGLAQHGRRAEKGGRGCDLHRGRRRQPHRHGGAEPAASVRIPVSPEESGCYRHEAVSPSTRDSKPDGPAARSGRAFAAELTRRLTPDARITVLTGAGVSAASGVPTFRGAGGLWKNFKPESLATPQAFARDPRLVWEWYDWRRQKIAACEPNAAHQALASWTQRFPNFRLITQNVDGLHEAALAACRPEASAKAATSFAC